MNNMKKRELTICGMSVYDRKRYPFIRLNGKWLEALGFEIGKKITVEEKQGELVLKMVSAEV